MDQTPTSNLDNATTIDRLGFDVYVRQIVSTIRDATDRKQLPLTIGVYGRWGSGKTSLMKMVEARLTRNAERRSPDSTSVRWARLIVAAWTIGLLTSLLFASSLAACLAALMGWRYELILIGGLTAWFGAFGGACRSFSILWWRASVAKDLDRSHLRDQALYPFVGFITGATVFLLLGGLLTLLNVDAMQPVVVAINYILAWLSGLSWRYIVASPAYVPLWIYRRRVEKLSQAFLGPLSKGQNRDIMHANLAALNDVVGRLENLVGLPRRGRALATGPDFQVIWFNAWKFSKEDELWAALLQRILSQMQVNARGWAYLRIRWALWKRSIEWQSGLWDITRKLAPTAGKSLLGILGVAVSSQLAQVVVGSFGSADLAQAAGTATGLLSFAAIVNAWLRANVAEPLADVDLGKYRKKSSYKDHLTFFADFNQEFKELTEIARGVNNPIVLMLDDLDRCLPEQAVSILEAIKLFIGEDAPVVFLIGADRDFVERAIAVKYADLIEQDDANAQRKERFDQLGHEYLEKIIQLPFNLPPIESTRIDQFIDDTFKDDPRVTDYSGIFAAGLLPNPRQVLRVINIYRFVAGLANERGDLYFGTIDLGILAKLVIIQYRWQDLYADLVERNALLDLLELTFKKAPIDKYLEDADVYQRLVEEYQPRRELKRLLLLDPTLVGVNLRDYLFLTKQTQSQPQPTGPEQVAQKGVSFTSPVASVVTSTEAAVDRVVVNAGLVQLQEQIDKLKQQGGDSALISRLLERQAKAQNLIKSDDYTSAATLLQETTPLAEKALAELETRQRSGIPSGIEASVSKGGHLIFQRALTYEPVEITAYGGREKPLQFALTTSRHSDIEWSAERILEDLSARAQRYEENLANEGDLKALGTDLGKLLSNISRIPELRDPSVRLRLRLTTDDLAVSALPWELASFLPDQTTLGLDTRYSFVRGLAAPLAAQPVRTDNLRILVVVTGPQQSHTATQALNSIFASTTSGSAFETTFLEHATADDYFEALKEGFNIVHLIAPLERNETERLWALAFDDPVNKSKLISVDRLIQLTGSANPSVLFLDLGRSRFLAQTFAGKVPVVVGWQTNPSEAARITFSSAFYKTLVRTGQADFAITEARRAITTSGGNVGEACSPVMYFSRLDDVVFTN